jgi:hypothetical protein
LSIFNPVALLSWIDSKPNSPTSNDLDEFSQLVNVTVSRLALPPTVCTSGKIQEFVAQLEPTNLSGVAAVVGGILSQDVLNALGGRELPLKNWLIFDGSTCTPRQFWKALTLQVKGRFTHSWGRQMERLRHNKQIPRSL